MNRFSCSCGARAGEKNCTCRQAFRVSLLFCANSLVAAMLSGCTAAPLAMPPTITVTKVIYVPWDMPAYLKHCAADPAPLATPHIAATDPHAGSQVARYVVNLRAHDAAALGAADDCRNTVAAIVRAAAPPASAK